MGLPQGDDSPTTLYIDNQSCILLSRDRKSCHKSRHIDRRFFKIREYVFAGVIRTVHIPTELNPADLLTKVLPPDVFARHTLVLLGAAQIGDASSVEGGDEDSAVPVGARDGAGRRCGEPTGSTRGSSMAGALYRAPALSGMRT